MIEKNVIKMLPSKQTSFYYFTCLPRREHIIFLVQQPLLLMSGKESFSFSAFLYPTGISDSRHRSEHCIPAIPPDNQVQSE